LRNRTAAIREFARYLTAWANPPTCSAGVDP